MAELFRPASRPRPERYRKVSSHPDFDWQEWEDTITHTKKWIPSKQRVELGINKAFQMPWTFPTREGEEDAPDPTP
jgi:hypothetical protein